MLGCYVLMAESKSTDWVRFRTYSQLRNIFFLLIWPGWYVVQRCSLGSEPDPCMLKTNFDPISEMCIAAEIPKNHDTDIFRYSTEQCLCPWLCMYPVQPPNKGMAKHRHVRHSPHEISPLLRHEDDRHYSPHKVNFQTHLSLRGVKNAATRHWLRAFRDMDDRPEDTKLQGFVYCAARVPQTSRHRARPAHGVTNITRVFRA